MRHTYIRECPFYNSIRDKFQSLFENVVLLRPKMFVLISNFGKIKAYSPLVEQL